MCVGDVEHAERIRDRFQLIRDGYAHGGDEHVENHSRVAPDYEHGRLHAVIRKKVAVVEHVGHREQAVERVEPVMVHGLAVVLQHRYEIVLGQERRDDPHADEARPQDHDQYRQGPQPVSAALQRARPVVLVAQTVDGRRLYASPYLVGVPEHVVRLGTEHIF